MTWNELAVGHWATSDAPAIVDDDGNISGRELLERAAGAAAWFDDLGFVAGDAVPVLMDETAESIAMVVGGAMSRRPVAPLGTKLSAEDLSVAVVGLGARHMFVAPERLELAEQVRSRTGIELVVGRPLPRAAPLAGDCTESDTVVIVHTSGTTGHPKPVRVGQGSLVARVDVYREVMGIGRGDRYCSASPFYHTAGVAMDVTVLGMGVAIIPQDWFSIDKWRGAGRLGVTCALLVPTMIEMLLAEGALGDAKPRVLQYGAMPIHPETLKAAMKALPGTQMLQIFGQTEASPISSLSHADHGAAVSHRPELLLSVGGAVPGVELRVEQSDGEGIGEIAIRAPHVFQCDDDGWRRTGDLGSLDDEGYITLHGRANDRIIRGGENIYPVEVEAALVDHPAVREAAVVGLPDRTYGEIVKAVVVPVEPGGRPGEDELRAFLGTKLAHFKVPSVIEFATDLPRTPSGKVLRRQLVS